jgi:hypothetical protein
LLLCFFLFFFVFKREKSAVRELQCLVRGALQSCKRQPLQDSRGSQGLSAQKSPVLCWEMRVFCCFWWGKDP